MELLFFHTWVYRTSNPCTSTSAVVGFNYRSHVSPSVLVTCTHRPFRSHLRLIVFYYVFQWFDSSKRQGTLSVWLHATKLWSCNFIKSRIRNLSSSTALLCVSVDMTRGRDAAWQRAPLALQMSTVFLKHAAEGSLASGCLQAVITQLPASWHNQSFQVRGGAESLRLLRYSVSRRGKSLSLSLRSPIHISWPCDL